MSDRNVHLLPCGERNQEKLLLTRTLDSEQAYLLLPPLLVIFHGAQKKRTQERTHHEKNAILFYLRESSNETKLRTHAMLPRIS